MLKQLLFAFLFSMVLFVAAGSEAGQNDILQKDPTRSYGAIDVILYQTSWCPYCTKARQLLTDMGVSLVVYDIEKDETKRAEMMEKSSGARGVPLVDVEGIIIRGYSPDAIKNAVEKRRRR